MTEVPRPTHAEEFLTARGIDFRPPELPYISNHEKLRLMIEAGVPIEHDTSIDIARGLMEEGDIEGVKLLHRHGQGSLLNTTSIFLLSESLSDPSDERHPVEKFDSILTDEVVERGRIDFDGRDRLTFFVRGLIGLSASPLTSLSIRDLMIVGRLDRNIELEMERSLRLRFPDILGADLETERENWIARLSIFEDLIDDPLVSKDVNEKNCLKE